jgi:four helix bundle protein
LRPFTDLVVWQRAHSAALDVYRVTAAFPPDERFGITSQVRRAATSIPASIAEGSSRSPAQFGHFLTIALGSAAEVDYFLILAADLGYLSKEDRDSLAASVTEVKRLLVAYRKSLEEQAAARRRETVHTKS